MRQGFKLGSKQIADAANPQPHEIDVEFMWARLGENRRFNGHPDALTIHEHMLIVAYLAHHHDEPKDVWTWAVHHDCHEYATSDIPTPIKRLLGTKIVAIERAWDRAICGALGAPVPTEETRKIVKKYDNMAASCEWYNFLKNEPHPDFKPLMDGDLPKVW